MEERRDTWIRANAKVSHETMKKNKIKDFKKSKSQPQVRLAETTFKKIVPRLFNAIYKSRIRKELV